MKRYKHTLSNYHLLTCDMGRLIPVGLQEALPGDTFDLSTSALIRVSPLAAPVMHPVTVRLHHFFVPHRLVWDGWEDFITGGPDGNNADFPPQLTGTASTYKGSQRDYYGIPEHADGVSISYLPFYGYNTIWNEYYRDQDLEAERAITLQGTADIAWEKDYFTAARPWTQKGDDVTLPVGTRAPIKGLGWSDPPTGLGTNVSVRETDAAAGRNFDSYGVAHAAPWTYMEEDPLNAGFPNVWADLSSASAIPINDFRRAFALQRYQEARARYGSRYTEYLRHIGVRPSDARLQRPEYLGGGSTRINFSEVLQTAEPTAGSTGRTSYGMGDMYGHGIAAMRSNRVRRFIEEHGYIHSLMSVRPKAIYMNGVHRHFLKMSKEDFYQKELAHIGQQPVGQDEIYAQPGQKDMVFGYQDRYREYRESPSYVAGEYRDTLNYWHMARDLPSTTTLNSDFIKCIPTKRIHNVQTEHALWCMVNNHVVARRMVARNAQGLIL